MFNKILSPAGESSWVLNHYTKFNPEPLCTDMTAYSIEKQKTINNKRTKHNFEWSLNPANTLGKCYSIENVFVGY